MAAKKKLGKGLSEIFGDDIDTFLNDIEKGSTDLPGTTKSEIAIKDIRPNPYQPRRQFDEEGLNELAESIRINGVFQPILIRKSAVGYELVAGERRLRASKLAGRKTIPAIIVDFNDTQMMEVSLLENIQRKDLTVIEEANAYEQLIKKLNYTQDELAKRIGKSRSNVTNLLRLLNLPDEVKQMVNDGKLTYGHARALLGLKDKEEMARMANKAVHDDLTVRQLEALCSKTPAKKTPPAPKKTDPFKEDVRSRLQRKYGTSVQISDKAITIQFKDTKDLNRILEIMGIIEE